MGGGGGEREKLASLPVDPVRRRERGRGRVEGGWRRYRVESEVPVCKEERSNFYPAKSQMPPVCKINNQNPTLDRDKTTTMATPDFYRDIAAAAAATSANPTPDRCSHLPPAPVTLSQLASHRYFTDTGAPPWEAQRQRIRMRPRAALAAAVSCGGNLFVALRAPSATLLLLQAPMVMNIP